jgi:hypothetical protein
MRVILVFCLLMLLSSSPVWAGEGTIPEPVYVAPLVFHDIAFTGDTVQLGINDYGRGIVTAAVWLESDSALSTVTLTHTIYSTSNTSWLVAPIAAGEWTLRQVYAKDEAGNELNLFFVGPTAEAEADEPQRKLYLPQVSN